MAVKYIKSPSFASPQFDSQEFSDAVQAHGSTFVHYRILPCPIGRIDPNDSMRRPHTDHSGCFSGFLHQKVGSIKIVLSGNSQNLQFTDQGLMDSNPVQATLDVTYQEPNRGPVRVAIFDRFYLDEESILVPHWEMLSWSGNPVDSLKFPAEKVETLIDSSGKVYVQCEDFDIVNGYIKWGNINPGLNPETGKGNVYSVRYLYRPYFTCTNMGHEIRVVSKQNPITGETTITQSHQQMTLRREVVYRNADNIDPSKAPESKQELSPAQIDYGSR